MTTQRIARSGGAPAGGERPELEAVKSLDRDPFDENADYFQTETHCGLLTDLAYNHLEKTRGVALITGGPATLQALLQRLDADAVVIKCRPEMTSATIIDDYGHCLGERAAAGDGTRRWPRIAGPATLSPGTCPLVLEAAELLSDDVLAELCGGESIADPDRPPILLTAPEKITERLPTISGDLLGSTIFAHFPGECLAEAEVGSFIDFQQGRGKTAAGDVFRPEIVYLIAAFADGDPAVVNSLAVGILEAVRGTAHSPDKAGSDNVDLARDEGTISGAPARNGAAEAAENREAPPDKASLEALSGAVGPLPVVDTVEAIAVERDDGGEPITPIMVRDGTPVLAGAAENSQAIPVPPAARTSSPSPASDGESRGDIAAELLEAPTAGVLDRPKENRAEPYSGPVSAVPPRRRARSALRWLAAGAALGLVSAGAVVYRFGPAPVGAGWGEDRLARPEEVLPTAVAQPLDQPQEPSPPAVADATKLANPMPAPRQSAPLGPSTGTTMPQPTSAQDAPQRMPEPATSAAAAPSVAPAIKPSPPAVPPGAAIPTEQLAATIDQAPTMRAADAPQPMTKAEPSAAAANGASQGEAGSLVRRGDQLMSIGDIASARSFFELAAAKDEGAVATRIAKTYDPLFLEQSGVHGGLGNTGKAMAWYRKGIAAGDLEAVIRLQLLRDKYPE